MKKGFTLVELSIVLVIIGLLIGGILAAQSMIITARVNAQIKQFQQFDIATNNFKGKYNQIPGDCFICNHFWNIFSFGNGKLEAELETCPPTTLYSEIATYFPNLYEMQAIPDAYMVGGGVTYKYGKNQNYPEAAIGRVGLAVTGNQVGDIFYMFLPDNTNTASIATRLSQGAFSPQEALAIDTKIDDAKPGAGNAIVSTSSVNNTNGGSPYPMDLDIAASSCTTAGTAYNTARSEINLCRLMVKAQIH